jgi:hypothetical protein
MLTAPLWVLGSNVVPVTPLPVQVPPASEPLKNRIASTLKLMVLMVFLFVMRR